MRHNCVKQNKVAHKYIQYLYLYLLEWVGKVHTIMKSKSQMLFLRRSSVYCRDALSRYIVR